MAGWNMEERTICAGTEDMVHIYDIILHIHLKTASQWSLFFGICFVLSWPYNSLLWACLDYELSLDKWILRFSVLAIIL